MAADITKESHDAQPQHEGAMEKERSTTDPKSDCLDVTTRPQEAQETKEHARRPRRDAVIKIQTAGNPRIEDSFLQQKLWGVGSQMRNLGIKSDFRDT